MRPFIQCFIQNQMWRKNSPNPDYYLLKISTCFCKPLLRSVCSVDSCPLLDSLGSRPHKLISTSFIEIFSIPWERPGARRVWSGVTALLVADRAVLRLCGGDSSAGTEFVPVSGGICWGPAGVLITPVWDRACINEPRALFHRHPGVKSGISTWRAFSLSLQMMQCSAPSFYRTFTIRKAFLEVLSSPCFFNYVWFLTCGIL